MICDVYTLGCLAKPCRCALMMLYLKTKNQKQSRLKLISVSYGGFFFFLGWTHDLSCTHPAQTKKKKKFIWMLKQLFRVLRKKPGRKMPIMMIGQSKPKTKKLFIEPPTKKSCMETTSLEFLGWNCTGISVHSFLNRCGDGAVTESDRALHSPVRRPCGMVETQRNQAS